MPPAPSPDPRPAAPGPVPPRTRRAGLRARIKALLAARLRRQAAAPPSERPGSRWPDSFFDGP